MQELKQCPFCGCSAMLFGGAITYRSITPYKVMCASRLCSVSTKDYDKKEFAISAWNSRYDNPCK